MKSIIIDFEAMGTRPDCIVLDLAAAVFDINANDRFTDLVNSTSVFHCKFNADQPGRTVAKSTLAWWAKQEGAARKIMLPAPHDVTLIEGMELFKEFCTLHSVDPRKSLGYSRGTSYDFPILADILSSQVKHIDLEDGWPVAFWNQRDVRSAVAFAFGMPDLREVPLPKGSLDGFVKHNSIHDVCKDIVLMQHCLGYIRGTIEMPEGDAAIMVR